MTKNSIIKQLKEYYYHWLKFKNKIFQGSPIFVLMYHRIDDCSDEKMENLTVTPNNFEQQMHWIKEHFSVIRLTDNWGEVNKTSIVITFDDGYANNYLNALPVLEKYNIPATLFITTLHINKNEEFWWDKIASLYQKLPDEFYLYDVVDLVTKIEYPHSKIKKTFSRISPNLIMEKITEIEDRNHIKMMARSNYLSVNEEQLQQLNKHPLVDIGIHTHQHIPFVFLSADEQLAELNSSKEIMTSYGVDFIPFFALPNGSYSEETLDVVKKNGFEALLLANNYFSNNYNKKKRRINRILVPNLNEAEFKNFLKYYL